MKYYSLYDDPQNARQEHVFISDGYMKIESGFITTIFNLRKQEITYYNSNNKKFWKGNHIKFNADVKEEMQRKIDQEILNADKDQQVKLREMYDEMLKSTFDDNQIGVPSKSYSIKRLSKEQTVAGYKSSAYHVFEETMPLEVIWIATDLKISQEFDFRGFSNLLQKLIKGSYGSSFENSDQYFKLLDEGYPTKVEMRNQDGKTSISEVIKAIKVVLNETDFKVPSGYTISTLTDVGVWNINQ